MDEETPKKSAAGAYASPKSEYAVAYSNRLIGERLCSTKEKGMAPMFMVTVSFLQQLQFVDFETNIIPLPIGKYVVQTFVKDIANRPKPSQTGGIGPQDLQLLAVAKILLEAARLTLEAGPMQYTTALQSAMPKDCAIKSERCELI